jgi:NAD(P)-dependent dehydrogenase (short-subunit alcohol dehydrogenase family)
MYPEFKDKVALITGAGKFTGIGFGVAKRMAECGARVVITDLGEAPDKDFPIPYGSPGEMKKIERELQARFGAETLALSMDVTDPSSIDRAMQAVRERFRRLDYLFNNAGTAVGAPQAVHLYDEAAWLKTVDVNLHGVFRVSRAAVPLMLGRPGAIVNVASRAGKSPAPYNGAYAASKAAVIMLTKVMAVELAGDDIRVNAICPGLIRTDLQEGNIALKAVVLNTSVEEAEKQMTNAVPMGRMGTIEEVADLAAYLASTESSYITGQAVNIGGGFLMEL